MKNTIKYYTKNLYIGILAEAVISSDKTISVIDSSCKNPFIIFERITESVKNYIYKQEELIFGADIFTNKRYLLYGSNEYTAHKMISVGNFVIVKSIPIEQYLKIPKEKISETELLELYEEINIIVNTDDTPYKDNKEATDILIKDDVLKLILKANEKLLNSDLDISEKNIFNQKLTSLAKEYVEKVSKLQTNTITLTLDTENSIFMEFVKKIVEIEFEIDNKSARNVSSLQRQFECLKKILGSYDN